MNNKGEISEIINGVGGAVFAFMFLIFVVFAVLYGISALNPGSFFTANSAEQNATNDMTRNLTSGISQFSGKIPTIFLVLGIILILGGLVILIAYVSRMRSVGGAGSGGSL